MSPAHGCPSFSALVNAYQGPHSLYNAARQQGGIFFESSRKCWIVTAHRIVQQVLDDPRFSSELHGNAELARPCDGPRFIKAAIQRQILFSDGKAHVGVQEAILRETARRSRELRDVLHQLALEILQPLLEQGRFDLVTDFALPYSLGTICRVVGIPHDDQEQLGRLARWSSTYADVTSGYLAVPLEHIVLLGQYFRDLVTNRPSINADDLIGKFRVDGTFDTDEDLIINCMMIFSAGRVTTQKLLGNGIPYLLPKWKRWRERARDHPMVIRKLTEELLRFVTPTRYLARHAREDVDIRANDGETRAVRVGHKLILFLEAANRDPATFSDPQALEPDRKPNSHLAFGYGAHRCPGASVARLEIRIALKVLFDLFPELSVDPQRVSTWEDNPNLGGYSSFPVTIG